MQSTYGLSHSLLLRALNNPHSICHLVKIYDAMMLFKPASTKDYKGSH